LADSFKFPINIFSRPGKHPLAFYPANISASFRLLFAKPALCFDVASQTRFQVRQRYLKPVSTCRAVSLISGA